MLIEVGDRKFNVEIADTEELRKKGLQGRESLSEDEGMLFIFESPQSVDFWMQDTAIPLDIIFINEDDEVISVKKGVPFDETLLSEDEVLYVLEVSQNSGISEGDELELEDTDEDEIPIMKVIGSDGSSQMELVGGERIFSRKNTKTLIKMAKKAYSQETDSAYKSLGKKIFKYLNIQDNNTPEYVDVPDNK